MKNKINKKFKLHNKKPSKKNKSFKIEILDFIEKTKYEKNRNRIKTNWKLSKSCIASLLIIILVLTMTNGKTVINSATRKILDGLGIYTQEVKSVEIESTDYDNPGSWHIDKSAKWTGSNTAQVTFDVDSIIKAGNNYKDIVLVLDTSGSMAGDKMERAISDSKELVDYILSNTQNRIAIVTFDSSSTVVSNFTNNKTELLSKLDTLSAEGATNYNVALQNVDVVMNGYTKQQNRNVVTLFLTDGYPNVDTPNQIGTYEVLKDKYPYMAINGVQYEMGEELIDEIKEISDSQWVADRSTLNNVLFDASGSFIVYEEFIITDYIDNDYFTIGSVNDIKVTMGTVTLQEEQGVPKIIWNLGTYMAGGNPKMDINLTLKPQYVGGQGFYPTNKREIVTSKLPNDTTKTVNSTLTPVLKNIYQVIYDTNTPTGCTLPSIASENHTVYQNVTKRTNTLSCQGYLFKGWEIDEDDAEDIKMINSDVFVMPEHDVTIRATWAKQSIVKTMDGTVHERPTLYNILKNEATSNGLAREYTGSHQDSMDASKSTKKIYHYYATNNDEGTAILDKNNVIFAGHCWQMIRTTDTGGVKMIYNGEPENNQCLNTRGTHVGYAPRTSQNLASNYWYGTDYTYDSVNKTFKVSGATEQVTWNATTGPSLTGKYTCKLTNVNGTCSTLYLVESYQDATSGYVIPLNSSSNYSQFGTLQFNVNNSSPSYVGYMHGNAYDFDYIELVSREDFTSNEGIIGTIVVGSSITDNGDGTYTINNPTSVTTSLWHTNYANYKGKYTCNDSNATCTNPRYITATNYQNYKYLNAVEKIMLGKTRSGTALTDTVLVRKDELIKNLSNYSDYKYTCNTDSAICTESTLRMISDFVNNNNYSGYYYALNHYYGSSVNWNGTNYTLVNPIEIENYNNLNNLSTHHYMCVDPGLKTCQTVAYVYYYTGLDSSTYSYAATMYYIILNNGLMNISTILEEMLTGNTINSTIKSGVDAWYKHYLLEDYDNYIEDTIFCSNRTITSIGGWDSNSGMTSERLIFEDNALTNDLRCTNITDRFSVSNNSARLTYKVGLISFPEVTNLNTNTARATGQNYYVISPGQFHSNSAFVRRIYSGGGLGDSLTYNRYGVRPAISLKPGTKYNTGNGSMATPYIVDTTGN